MTRDLFNTFRIRAAFYHNPLAWDLEVRVFLKLRDVLCEAILFGW